MHDPGMERLREHLRQHNRWVLGLVLATLAASALLWTGLYFISWWLFLLAWTVSHPLDAQPPIDPLLHAFAASAILLCLFAWTIRRMQPNSAARDSKGVAGHGMDLLLAVPRMTLSILGTGAAAARLSENELEQAWLLLRRMDKGDNPILVQTLPLEIPDSTARSRILMALRISGLIEIRPTSQGSILAFQNQKARHLAQERVRLRL